MPMQHTQIEGHRLLTPAEVGRQIGRSRATVYRLINSGRLEVVQLPVAKPNPDPDPDKPKSQGATRITSESLASFIESLTKAS